MEDCGGADDKDRPQSSERIVRASAPRCPLPCASLSSLSSLSFLVSRYTRGARALDRRGVARAGLLLAGRLWSASSRQRATHSQGGQGGQTQTQTDTDRHRRRSKTTGCQGPPADKKSQKRPGCVHDVAGLHETDDDARRRAQGRGQSTRIRGGADGQERARGRRRARAIHSRRQIRRPGRTACRYKD